jgi:3-methyladenine DNA glycosylase AlkC
VNTSSSPQSKRTGASRRADIPPRVLRQLNRGELETVTLVETLAVDFPTLLCATVPGAPRTAVKKLRAARDVGVTRRMALAGAELLDHLGPAAYLRLARHRSDIVRGWAAFLLAATPHFTLGERLQLIRPLANDHNAGVREWAWLALRPLLAAEITHAIDLLEPWTISSSPFQRRFASEATRPRGVWCAQIQTLKESPQLGLPIIEPLRADPHRYVQDSVANWLNDAAKSRPGWVRETCIRWQRESPAPATARICQRATRNLAI